MKTKLVFKATNEKEEKLLLALSLRAEDNMVDIYTFSGEHATPELEKQLLNEWRTDKAATLPEPHTKEEKELSVGGTLLPEGIKVDREDILQRAQTEWHFVVLSSKLNAAYQAELNELKEKVEQLSSYDSKTWEQLKTFWNKVQEQVRDRNLFRDHANSLREHTNALFSRLKEMRATLDAEFQEVSKEHFDKFTEALAKIEEKIKADAKVQGIFDELKNLQRKFKDTKLTREHRSKIWERIDAAFKEVKEKRFGPNAGDSSPYDRLKRRYDGLLNAIQKMERSIKRDRDDLKFQNRKIEQTDGQLEAQIRKAKIKMIEERVNSKDNKLADMLKTKTELEKRLEVLKQKEAKQKEREEVEKARLAAKEKIKNDIKAAEQARTSETNIDSSTQQNSAAADGNNNEESVVDVVTDTVEDVVEDVIDTVKAIAEVLGGKISDAVADAQKVINDVTKEGKEEEE